MEPDQRVQQALRLVFSKMTELGSVRQVLLWFRRERVALPMRALDVRDGQTLWNLSRNTKKALPNLRDVGHISAHSRRYTAQKPDILKISQDCRIVIEEFLHLAGLIT